MNKAFKLDKTNIEDIVNLTSLQEGILFHYLKDVSKNSYFVQLSLEIQGSVKFDYFQKAWNKVVENNEMLRTVFRWEKLNKPVQVILKENNVDIRYYDLLIEENKLESEYQKIKLKDYNESFDLREVPFRLTLCKFKTDKYILLISNHHIIYDGWSNGIILKEFLNYYNELVTGSLLKVNKKTSFKNYLKLNREPSTEDESFWKDYLNGFEPKNVFSFKNTGSLSDNSNNQSHRFSISEDKFSKLKQLCKSQKLSIADILYGAWGILLSKYSGETDMLFGTIVSGRNIKFEGIERMVGLFINTIPIRIRITSDKTLISILKENAKQTLERGRFENVPLLNILDYSGYKENELIESIFVVENYPLDKENLQQQEELAFKSFSIQETTNYKLTVSALISDEIEISFNYISAYFERELIENIEKHYVRIIDKIIDDNKSAIQSLDLLSDIEKHQLLYEFNNTKRDYPKDKTIHQLFEEQVALAPDRIALIMGDRRISYFDLNKMSNQVALNLLEFGVCSESIVGLLVDRSVEMMIGILGILKAGGAYLPIDPEAPEKRINYILDDSNAKVLLLQKNKKEGKNYILPVMVINSDLSIKEEDLILEDNTNAHNLSYVIYTSGSTGEPKGVMIEHHSVINRLKWMQDSYPIGSKDVLIQKTPYTFDVSVWELFWWSLEGSTLFLLEKGGEKDPSQIVKGISENNVSIIHFVPSMLDVFLEYLKDYYQHSSLESLRYIFASGEELKNSHVEKFYEVFGKESKCLLVNLYGPTEATVDVTYFNCNSKDQYNSIPIGKPIANTQVCILNTTNRQLQAIGIIGELCLSGVGLSRGYLGMEDLTSEKFIDHPFKEGERLYRTGDLARWLPDGNIEFLGRIDHQVKIRGFRIELGEIENVILQYKNIKECVVLVREDQGDKYLCAYMVSGKEQNTEELRTYLSGLLPDYMLPSYFLYLEEMPLTGNGKLNRKSLPAPEIKAGSAYIAPKNIIETKLVKIWSEVLNVASKEISTNVSFFEFGGHSLKATVLVSRIHNELDVQLELREVFKFPTIQTQAELINSSETTSYFSIPKAKTEEYYPLSSSQRRLYLLQQIDLGSMAYNMPGLISVPKDYNKHQIEEVFYKLIARHENFRTSFEVENELPVQRIHSEVSFSIKNYQITNTELSNVRENFVHAFDLSLAPLLRVVYLEISDGDDMLLVDMHHIISDGKSHSILEEDFSQLLLGKELAPLHLQYKDYSQWQNSKEQQERINGQETYWLDKFTGELPVLELPTDHSRPVMQSFEGAKVSFVLSAEETKIIHGLCKDQGLTLYMSLLSIFTILLSKLSGQDDIIVGSPIAARRHLDLEDIVGMFVNTLAIRSDVSGDKQLIEYLQELKENTLEAYENQEYQFEDLVEKLVVNRDTSRNPLFDVMFNLLEGEFQEEKDSSKEELKHIQGISKFDLSLTALDLGSEIHLSLEYSTKLFNPETIERFINYFRQLIQSLSGKQEQKIKNLNILPEAEKQQLLYKFNDTKRDYPKDKTIHQLFEEQVERTPDRIALNYNDQIITYRELNSRSNQLGQILLEKGVNSEDIVGLLVDRSIEMLIGILGILKAGGAYLPIDPSHPESRIKYILENSNSQLILCLEIYKNKIDLSFHIFLLEEGIFTKDEKSNLDIPITPTNLCYVIYTSGSTGTPKGVNIEHLSVLNLLYFLQDKYPIRINDSYLLKTSYCFDVSISELFGWIQGGGKLCILETGHEKDAVKIIETINKSFVTHINFVPSVFNSFSESIPEINKNKLISLRYILLAGEALLSEHLKTFKSYGLDIQIDNLYGPTEATVFASYYKVDLDEVGSVSIGRPLSNYEIYILDKNLKLQAVGVSGELLIGGKGLARNYLNNLELTTEKFIEHPFKEGEKLYKTGDLARWLPDGNIEFLGRIDDQVKIRGFRIELGEIENTLLRYKNIKESVVLVWGQGEDKYLCAYVVVEETFNKEEIRNYLSEHLPNYMIPTYFVALEKIPLTRNGKIDKKSLLAPEIKAGSDYVAPNNLIETKLVKIWSEVLNVVSKEISTHVSFFELGGHSLKATVLVSRIHKELDVRLELQDIFKYQSIQGQSELISSSESSSYLSIPKAKNQDYYPLSSSQRRLYLLQQMDLGSTAYNMPGLLAVPKGKNKHQITAVFHKLIDRHENFRTSFEVENEMPVQRIHSEVTFSIKDYQITNSELLKIKEDFVQAFDLSLSPLLRVGYLEISDGDDMLLVDMHHIISDGRSYAILEKEFNQLISGKELAPLHLKYKDYSQWQNSTEQQERIKGQEAYWLDKFTDELPVLEIPTDYSRPLVQSFEGASVGFVLSPEETKIIHEISKEQGLTLYMSLLSIFTILLSKLSGLEDIIVGSPIAARRHADLEDIVGMFVNTLAIRSDVSRDKRLIDYLQELKENTLEAYENQEYQFEDLIDKVVENRDASRNPIFDVMFNLLEGESQEIKDSSKEELIHNSGTSKFDLNLTALNLGSEIELNLEYSTNLFNPETIEQFIKYFKQIIKEISKDPYKLIGEIKIITEIEEKYIRNLGEGLKNISKNELIHELFSQKVKENPLNVALVFNDKVISYRQLEEKSNSLARTLRAKGVKANDVIGLMVERSFEMIIGILGILKSGGACLPIDLNYPEERKIYMLKDCEVKIVLKNENLEKEKNKPLNFVEVVDLNKESNYDKDNSSLPIINNNKDLFYVIYTSGSTGQPKGVMLEHRNLINLIENNKYVNIELEKVLQFNSISFDVSFQEIFSTLLYGGTLYLIKDDERKEIPNLFDLVKKHSISTVFFPTAYTKTIFNDFEDIDIIPSCIKHVVTAGEQLIISDVFRNYLKQKQIYLHNHYGPSETHVVTTFTIEPNNKISEFPSIGYPIQNTSIFILDRFKNIQPIGVSGELYIEGASVGRGYFGRDLLTSEKFISHPFKEGERLYRTGDLARLLPDGNIEFLGRLDHQVKIRGFRIELGEIESNIQKYDDVKDVAVLARKDKKGDNYLCAYVVGKKELKFEILRSYLTGILPEYMIPSYFVALENIPLTSNGKIDKKSLPEPEVKAGGAYVAPKTLIESKLVKIWSEVLNVASKEISTNVSFFELGGHSLKATVLVSRIHKELDVRLELRDIFKYQNIQGQSVLINSSENTSYFSIPKTKIQEYYPLSSSQRRLYLLQQMDLEGTAYNMPGLISVPKDYDKHQIEEVFHKLIARHENFRTSFEVENELPVQRIHSEVSFSIKSYQITNTELSNVRENFVHAFDLSHAPLLRVGYLEIIDGDDMLLVDMHHIISDGRSHSILEEDFSQLLLGKELAPLHLQYKDYSQWQNSKEQQERINGQETYWLDKFTGELPVLELPTDNSRPVMQSFEGAKVSFVLSAEETKIIHGLCKDQGLTLYMSLLSIFTILLSKLSGQDDIIVGSPITARRHLDLEDIVGMFVNTLAIRSDVLGDKGLIDYLQELKENTLEAYENQEYQFEDLVEKLVVNRDTSRNPLFDVMFNLLEGEFQEEKDSSKEELKHIQGISKFDLSLTALDLGSVIRLSFEYSTKLFRTESINRFISYFKHLLKDLPDNFGRYIKDINIIPEEEKKQILYDFNDTETDYLKNKCIHELFEEQVERTPNSDALIIGGRHISYREFNTMCNRLALVLVELGVYSESIVSLQIDRSVEMMVGIMGILKAGGTYLPIDSEAPEKRVNYILNDSNSKVLLLHKDKKKGNNYNLPVLAIDLDQTAKKELLNLGKTTNAQKLSYVIYTSGSTGEPKGVMIEHHSVINRLKWMQNSYPIGSNDILIQKTPYTFDVSVWELFWWSFEGSSLFLLEKGGEKDPLKIASSISENKVSIIHFVPSMLDVFLDYLIEHKNVAWLDSLRFVFASGEELKVRHVEKFYEIFGTDSRCLLVNLYGPTEATVDVTYFNCNQDQYNSIPIGKPIANTQVYILNRENRQLQAIGVVGELCLSGVGLSRGYLGMEELTSEKFIDHPYKKGEKLYRTGDLARWLDDGNIEFLGRIDDQVKIRGFRIELGEIENTLLRYKNIKESVVLVWGQGEDKYLCAYVVVEEVFNKEEIRNYLSEHLPNYMIPTYFVALEKIPLTRNGKIDKKSLLAPEIKAGSDYVAPNNLIETKLVKIWSEVLNIATKEISTNVSFFELGGHSLKATVLVSRIHKELDVRLELRDIFQYQTIQVQSELINSSESSSYFSIPKAKKQDYYPLSSSQRRLYLLQQMDLGSTAYNMPGLLAVPKGQDKNQIKEVFNKLIARHENFRTSFEFEDEIPVQRIHSEVAFSIKEYQIKKSELSNIKEDFVKAFDLNLAPLLRVGYLEISDGDDMLLIDMHHIISDGRSYAILEENFSQLLAGKELEALHLQYKDYSQWQNSKEQQERIKVQESYWLDKFTGELPILELPTDNSRPVMQSFEGASVSFVLSAEETKIIHDLCKGQGLTLYMSLLSVFTILLSKLSGQEDIIVGSPIAARRHSDLEDIVGMFVNTLALRNEVSGDKCLIDYLQELKENTLEAYENQEYQFEDLVEMLVVNRDTSRNPIFDVMFNLLEIDSEDFQEIKEGESIHEDWVSKFDLSLSALDSGSSVQLSFQYSTKLFKSETIDRFISYFKQIINQLPEKLNEKLSELEIITEAEKQQLLYDFNDTKRDYPRDKTIHQLFEEQVERTLLKNALIFEQEGLSYYDLNQKSNQIAHYLRNNGVTRNSVVALIFEPSHEMIICLLGVLKSGACYLPINLELPNDRISYILSDSESSLILTNNSSYNENPFNINLIHINDNFFNKESGNPECINTVADPIYVIYTSGTTGKPKGVILKHENLINYTSWFNNFKQLGHEEKTVLTTSYSFDLGYTSIYSSLVNGYELHLLPKELYLSTRDFNRYIIDNKISYLKTTPSLYSSMVDCDLFAMAIKNLKLLLLGGESINTYVVEKTISLNEDIQIINHYGPTEATIGCITYPISKENLNSFLDRPVIGNPIHNTNAYIVDESVNLLPIGVAGELCISGEGLAQGYLNNLSLTDEKFISHPFKNGEKLYRTGDLARWLPEGNVEFLGRIDNQVKIRGYRIELEEISNVLKAHENIEECEVLAREENRDKYLCAYLVTEEDLKEEELRTYLSESLPDYMIPSYFVELDKIPLTSNGKVDRKSLPVPEIKAGSGYVAPQTLIETKLVKIWSEVLNVASKEISTNANFFELGGHSLKATVLVSRIHKELDVRIELREVFQFQTILAQSKLINSSENISYFSIPKAKTQEYYSLSSSQRRLYLLQQMDLGSTAYNMPGLLAVPKGQNKHQITAVFNKLIARHENFRTSFEVENEFPVQRIHSEVSFSIKSYQITNTELSNVRENFVHAFDLSHAPLLRVAYLEISDGDDMLFVDMHHIISDGKSHSILEEEFYQLLVGKELEPLRLQYKDYSEWQNSSGQQERIKEQESYWLDKFTDELPVLELPVDYPRPVMQSFEGASVRFVLPPEETAMIHDICREQGLTLYMSLLSVFTILLSKLSGQEDIIVGSPIAARRHSDLEDIVGMFVNTLAIRSDVSGDKQLIDYLQELKENTLEAYENQEYQFEDLVEKLVVNRDTSRNPLFDVMFNLLEGEFQEVKDSSKEELKHIQGISKFDLSLTALNLESELQLNIEYSTKLFRPETIERFIGYFKELVKSFSGNSVQTISELNILTEAEKQQLLYEFNDTRTDYPSDKSVYQLFEESARRFPKNIAVSTKNQSITYTDLWNRSDKLAKIIRSKGIHSGRVIGLMLDRSIEMIVGLMGVLKSGCCYLPLMPDMPISRFEYIMAESECNLVLTQTKYQEKLTTHIEIINLDVLESIPCFQQQKDVTRQPNDLAYIIYTSGTTGQPKGVPIENHSVVNRIMWMQKEYPIELNDVVMQKTPYTFDVSVWELFWWSFIGASVFMLEPEGEKDPVIIANTIDEHKINVMHFVPSMLEAFFNVISEDSPEFNLGSMKYVFSSGEVLKANQVKGFYDLFKENINTKLVNLYGPTEATVDVSYFECKRGIDFQNIPIGKPIDNIQLYILDKNTLNAKAIGVVGELMISGVGLSRGYLKQEKLTSEKFIEHPFIKGGRLYRTGDLTRWLPDGNIEFFGRIDSQVKIRGFRIELGEIESSILKYSGVKECVVLCREDQRGEKYLCAYVVIKSQENKVEQALRIYLSGLLPDYMIPTYFVELAKIPLTSNGKIDRKSLPTPEIKAGSSYEAPKTLIETKLIKIWSEVLAIASKEISTTVSFFELGGHSLKATVLVSRIHKELDVRLELREVFQYPTVQGQAELINSSESISYFSIPKARIEEYYPLSSSQRRLYLLQQMDLGSTAYNMPGLIAVPEGHEKYQIEDAFNQLISQHENFRTSFEVEDGLPVQRIHSEVSFWIDKYKITNAELSNVRKNFVQAFDLSLAPLLRVAYVEISDGDDMLLIDMHHIISDGKSHAILEEEFNQLIEGKELEPLRLQYKDYSQWQNSLEQQERIKGQEAYWLDKFTDELPVLELPTDYSRPVIQSFEGARVGFILSAEETVIIQDICREQGLTLYMSLLSVFTILLSKLSGQEDIIVGSPIAARRHADLDVIVGMFVNTLTIRNDVSGDKCLIDYLQDLKENTLEAYENQEYQFEDLVDLVVKNRDTSHNPLFDVMFNLLEGGLQEGQDSTERNLNHKKGVSKFDLSLTALKLGSELQLSFEYSTKLFRPETIERFIGHFKELVKSFSGNSVQTISELNILTESEKQQLLYDFNDTRTDYPKDKTIYHLFEEQVESTPDIVALVHNDQVITYLEFSKKVNIIANILQENGVRNDDIVGICYKQSINFIIGIISISKLGGCFIPLSLKTPEARLNYTIKDSNMKVLLSNEKIKQNHDLCTVLIIDDLIKNKNFSTQIKTKSKQGENKYSYIIYTSGSTGIPKGVLVNTQSLVNLCWGHINKFEINKKDHISKYADMSFDASIWEIFPGLIIGASLYIIPDDCKLDIAKMNEFFEERDITISFLPTQICEQFIKYNNTSLRILLTGGDKLRTFINTSYELYNNYGPTENTVLATRFKVEKKYKNIPIGKNVENTRTYILDKWNNIQPIGVAGEIGLSGDGLMIGYLNNQELTNKKLILNPFEKEELLYKTGDLARWLPDGNIEFLDRLDNQVKIRGFRIELGEIENCLLKHSALKDTIVISREDNTGEKYICAYVIPKKKGVNLEEILRSHILKFLPDYMLPSYFIMMDTFSLLLNGKINKKILPDPDLKYNKEFITPSNEIEEKLSNIWSNILNISKEKISTDANFFELGGSSLKVTSLVYQIHKEFNIKIPFQEVFSNPSIIKLAKIVSLISINVEEINSDSEDIEVLL